MKWTAKVVLPVPALPAIIVEKPLLKPPSSILSSAGIPEDTFSIVVSSSDASPTCCWRRGKMVTPFWEML